MLQPPAHTGIPLIDADHAQLFEALDRLHAAILSNQAAGPCMACLDFLAVYTVKHFEAEERLMRLHGYPELEAHQEDHLNLMRIVASLRTRLEGGLILESEASALLIESFERHIQEVDMRYVPYLTGHPAN